MRIAVVIVTFNRFGKLRKALDSYERQSVPIDDLIVVDNNSSDGTREFLDEWKQIKSSYNKHVLLMEQNLGGSGGFHDGCKYAMGLNPDWIFVADDDAYLDTNAISIFKDFSNVEEYAAVCASVIHMNGQYAYSHRRTDRVRFGFWPRFACSKEDDYKRDFFFINTFSYVGTFMNMRHLEKVGLCNRDYFIYFDDTEHAMRMSRVGDIICVPSIRVYHDDGVDVEKKSAQGVVSWRDYYAVRNMVYSYLQLNRPAGIYLVIYNRIRCYLGFVRGIKREMVLCAVNDALNGRLGIHSLYKPGFNPNQQ